MSMNENDQSKSEGTPHVGSSAVLDGEDEYWLKEADKVVAMYPEKHRNYHAMLLRHAYERGADVNNYWLLRAMAEWIVNRNVRAETQCQSHEVCATSGKCIIEWCVPCAARTWLEVEEAKEKPLAEPSNTQAEP